MDLTPDRRKIAEAMAQRMQMAGIDPNIAQYGAETIAQSQPTEPVQPPPVMALPSAYDPTTQSDPNRTRSNRRRFDGLGYNSISPIQPPKPSY